MFARVPESDLVRKSAKIVAIMSPMRSILGAPQVITAPSDDRNMMSRNLEYRRITQLGSSAI